MTLADEAPRRFAAATSRAELAAAIEDLAREVAGVSAATAWLRRSDGGFERPAREGRAAHLLDLDSRPEALERLARGPAWEGDAAVLARLADTGGEPATGALALRDRRGHLVGLLRVDTAGGAAVASTRDALADLAAKAGAAFEVIRLAEQIAERMDAARRLDRELVIAREVQSRLLPERPPELRNLDVAARCLQARSVGGDYFDFLPLGPGQAGLVIADVSGKGVHAALRMANLQAHLRSQAGSAPRDPLRVLRAVNRMLCESAHPGQFATLFLGLWSDASRRMSYINCGHNPPLVLRAGGEIEWLPATATVLGTFEAWDCALGRVAFAPGDVLVAYSDGVTEAESDDGLFGEERLVQAVRASAGGGAESVLTGVLEAVRGFAGERPGDDRTIVTGCVR